MVMPSISPSVPRKQLLSLEPPQQGQLIAAVQLYFSGDSIQKPEIKMPCRYCA
jgi:hypothetical protein